jgi:serpin B
MKKVVLFLLGAILVLTFAGCSSPQVTAAELKSDQPRNTAPVVADADLTAFQNGNGAFALNLYGKLKNSDSNLFFSPYSISEALAMTFGGARGTTATQMAAALQFMLAQDKLHPAFNWVDLQLAQRGNGLQGDQAKGFALNVANAIWGQKGFNFLKAYLDLLAQNYGAGMRIVDYINAAEQARQTINQWVSDQTAGKIPELLPQGSVNDMTRLVLTNAIYFKAAWDSQFQPNNTQSGQFHPLAGADITAQMMYQMKMFNYAEGSNYQAVELPYNGNQLAMDIILPSSDQYIAFESALNYEKLTNILNSMQSKEVKLTMPKFSFNSELGLKQTLSDLGMPVAFSPSEADLSGMDGNKDLYISDVIHKAFISVDEQGTEAAAATGVVVGTTSMPTDIKDFKMDHPFIFLIRDMPTGTILFMGRVMAP